MKELLKEKEIIDTENCDANNTTMHRLPILESRCKDMAYILNIFHVENKIH